ATATSAGLGSRERASQSWATARNPQATPARRPQSMTPTKGITHEQRTAPRQPPGDELAAAIDPNPVAVKRFPVSASEPVARSRNGTARGSPVVASHPALIEWRP